MLPAGAQVEHPRGHPRIVPEHRFELDAVDATRIAEIGSHRHRPPAIIGGECEQVLGAERQQRVGRQVAGVDERVGERGGERRGEWRHAERGIEPAEPRARNVPDLDLRYRVRGDPDEGGLEQPAGLRPEQRDIEAPPRREREGIADLERPGGLGIEVRVGDDVEAERPRRDESLGERRGAKAPPRGRAPRADPGRNHGADPRTQHGRLLGAVHAEVVEPGPRREPGRPDRLLRLTVRAQLHLRVVAQH